MTRDEWIDPTDTEASIREHVDRLARGDRLDVDTPTGTERIERRGPEWRLTHLGTGGGWCWSERMDTRRLVDYLTQWRSREGFDPITVRFVEDGGER